MAPSAITTREARAFLSSEGVFARMAKIALEKADSGDDFYQAKLATARFYFARLLPETAMLIRQARSGSANLMALDAALF